MPQQLLSLGSINADFQVRVDRPPGQAETQRAHALGRFSGGKAANVAVLARRLGCEVQLLGRVGDDDLSVQALAPLRDAGIDIRGVRRAPNADTAVSMIAVPPSGKKKILLAGEANLGYDEIDIASIERTIEAAPSDAMLVVDYEITPAAASRAIEAAHARGLRVVVDPSFPKAVERRVLPQVLALTPNESEALELAGTPDAGHAGLEPAARALSALGPPIVCIKLEDGGCLLWHEGQAWHRRALPVEPTDTTGAGDAFTAAFAVALLEGGTPAEASAYAVAATELAVATYGSQPAYPDRERLQAQLAAGERSWTRWQG